MSPRTPQQRVLLTLLLVYAVLSLVHFIHNAEYLADYPNLPRSWSPAHVYFAWIGMTAVGLAGWVLLRLGFVVPGLLVLAAYAALGLDSLGHYVQAPLSAHTATMNGTILAEVTAAGCVLFEVARQLWRGVARR